MASNVRDAAWLESVRVRTALAELYFREARYDACRRLIAELQAEGIDTPLARVGLAMLDYIDGRTEAVLAQLEHVKRMARVPARVWELVGRLYLRIRHVSEATSAFEQAIAMDPASPSAHHAWGLAHLLHGDPAAAEREFSVALQLGARSFEAYYHLAVALERQQRTDEAIETLKAAVAAAPAVAGPAHRRLSDLLQRCGQGALAMHHRALAQRSEFSGRARAFDVEWLKQGLAM